MSRSGLVLPDGFMNDSGGLVYRAVERWRPTAQGLLLVHDDMDLPLGEVRLKEGGGHGGHNGLRDLIAGRGDGFWRLRIGVGHPGTKSQVVDFVLTQAGKDEQRIIDETIADGADAIEQMLLVGAAIAMNKLHSRGKPAAKE